MGMQVRFLGVGDSTDEKNPTTSILIRSSSNLLLDCGYSAPQHLWQQSTDPNFLDGLVLSHRHGDHLLGVPAVLLRMVQDKRTRPLTIAGNAQALAGVRKLMELCFPNTLEKARFDLTFHAAPKPLFVGALKLSFAPSVHSVPNHAVRVQEAGKVVCYSGDGAPTTNTIALYKNANVLIHEAYTVAEQLPDHASIEQLLALAQEAAIGKLALVHVRRDVRSSKDVPAAMRLSKKVLLPKSGERLRV